MVDLLLFGAISMRIRFDLGLVHSRIGRELENASSLMMFMEK
jgi:hypothetical protein